MEIDKEFKQSDIGIIPKDWDCSIIGDYCFVTKLAGFEYTKYFDYSIGGSIIAIRALNISNGTLDLNDIHTIPKTTSDSLPRSKLCKDDLVMSYVGTLGRVAVITKDDTYHLAPNVAKLSPNNNHISSEYLCQYLNSAQGQKNINDASASTTQAALTMGHLREVPFARPPLPEQKAIAEVLSYVDAYIESLEELIAKKRMIKQGAMQDLLTRKRRLPGFSKKWEQKALGDIADISTGGRNNQDKVDNGKYPFFVRSPIVERINSYSYEGEAVLVPGEGNIGNIFHYIKGRFDVHQRVYAITNFSNDVSGKFVYYYIMQFFGNHALKNTVKATVDSLRLPTFLDFIIFLPQSKEEQNHISTILTDMDSEIARLQEKYEKVKEIKQGIMQTLLTGKIRLV